MTILLIEDEALAARKLSALIRAYNPTYHILATLESVADAVAWLSSHSHPDLIFLDIHLADGNGFDIFDRTTVHVPVIFTTAYDHYALRAFDLNSVHYVLKPVTREGIERGFTKLAALQSSSAPASLPLPDYALLTQLLRKTTTEYKTRFLVKAGSRIQSVLVEQVAYFYADEGVTFLMTQRRERFAIDYSLEDLEAKLNPEWFFRLNRQVLAHWQAIQTIHPHFKGRLKVGLLPASLPEIVISSETTPAFKQWMDR